MSKTEKSQRKKYNTGGLLSPVVPITPEVVEQEESLLQTPAEPEQQPNLLAPTEELVAPAPVEKPEEPVAPAPLQKPEEPVIQESPESFLAAQQRSTRMQSTGHGGLGSAFRPDLEYDEDTVISPKVEYGDDGFPVSLDYYTRIMIESSRAAEELAALNYDPRLAAYEQSQAELAYDGSISPDNYDARTPAIKGVTVPLIRKRKEFLVNQNGNRFHQTVFDFVNDLKNKNPELYKEAFPELLVNGEIFYSEYSEYDFSQGKTFSDLVTEQKENSEGGVLSYDEALEIASEVAILSLVDGNPEIQAEMVGVPFPELLRRYDYTGDGKITSRDAQQMSAAAARPTIITDVEYLDKNETHSEAIKRLNLSPEEASKQVDDVLDSLPLQLYLNTTEFNSRYDFNLDGIVTNADSKLAAKVANNESISKYQNIYKITDKSQLEEQNNFFRQFSEDQLLAQRQHLKTAHSKIADNGTPEQKTIWTDTAIAIHKSMDFSDGNFAKSPFWDNFVFTDNSPYPEPEMYENRQQYWKAVEKFKVQVLHPILYVDNNITLSDRVYTEEMDTEEERNAFRRLKYDHDISSEYFYPYSGAYPTPNYSFRDTQVLEQSSPKVRDYEDVDLEIRDRPLNPYMDLSDSEKAAEKDKILVAYNFQDNMSWKTYEGRYRVSDGITTAAVALHLSMDFSDGDYTKSPFYDYVPPDNRPYSFSFPRPERELYSTEENYNKALSRWERFTVSDFAFIVPQNTGARNSVSLKYNGSMLDWYGKADFEQSVFDARVEKVNETFLVDFEPSESQLARFEILLDEYEVKKQEEENNPDLLEDRINEVYNRGINAVFSSRYLGDFQPVHPTKGEALKRFEYLLDGATTLEEASNDSLRQINEYAKYLEENDPELFNNLEFYPETKDGKIAFRVNNGQLREYTEYPLENLAEEYILNLKIRGFKDVDVEKVDFLLDEIAVLYPDSENSRKDKETAFIKELATYDEEFVKTNYPKEFYRYTQKDKIAGITYFEHLANNPAAVPEKDVYERNKTLILAEDYPYGTGSRDKHEVYFFSPELWKEWYPELVEKIQPFRPLAEYLEDNPSETSIQTYYIRQRQSYLLEEEGVSTDDEAYKEFLKTTYDINKGSFFTVIRDDGAVNSRGFQYNTRDTESDFSVNRVYARSRYDFIIDYPELAYPETPESYLLEYAKNQPDKAVLGDFEGKDLPIEQLILPASRSQVTERFLHLKDSGEPEEPLIQIIKENYPGTYSYLQQEALIPVDPIYEDAGETYSPFDIDRDGVVNALTDGLLVLRGMFGLTDEALTKDTIGEGATKNSEEINQRLNYILKLSKNNDSKLFEIFDVDGDGNLDALTDGLLLLRYAFNIKTSNLLEETVAESSPFKNLNVETQLEKMTERLAPYIDDYKKPIVAINAPDILENDERYSLERDNRVTETLNVSAPIKPNATLGDAKKILQAINLSNIPKDIENFKDSLLLNGQHLIYTTLFPDDEPPTPKHLDNSVREGYDGSEGLYLNSFSLGEVKLRLAYLEEVNTDSFNKLNNKLAIENPEIFNALSAQDEPGDSLLQPEPEPEPVAITGDSAPDYSFYDSQMEDVDSSPDSIRAEQNNAFITELKENLIEVYAERDLVFSGDATEPPVPPRVIDSPGPRPTLESLGGIDESGNRPNVQGAVKAWEKERNIYKSYLLEKAVYDVTSAEYQRQVIERLENQPEPEPEPEPFEMPTFDANSSEPDLSQYPEEHRLAIWDAWTVATYVAPFEMPTFDANSSEPDVSQYPEEHQNSVFNAWLEATFVLPTFDENSSEPNLNIYPESKRMEVWQAWQDWTDSQPDPEPEPEPEPSLITVDSAPDYSFFENELLDPSEYPLGARPFIIADNEFYQSLINDIEKTYSDRDEVFAGTATEPPSNPGLMDHPGPYPIFAEEGESLGTLQREHKRKDFAYQAYLIEKAVYDLSNAEYQRQILDKIDGEQAEFEPVEPISDSPEIDYSFVPAPVRENYSSTTLYNEDVAFYNESINKLEQIYNDYYKIIDGVDLTTPPLPPKKVYPPAQLKDNASEREIKEHQQDTTTYEIYQKQQSLYLQAQDIYIEAIGGNMSDQDTNETEIRTSQVQVASTSTSGAPTGLTQSVPVTPEVKVKAPTDIATDEESKTISTDSQIEEITDGDDVTSSAVGDGALAAAATQAAPTKVVGPEGEEIPTSTGYTASTSEDEDAVTVTAATQEEAPSLATATTGAAASATAATMEDADVLGAKATAATGLLSEDSLAIAATAMGAAKATPEYEEMSVNVEDLKSVRDNDSNYQTLKTKLDAATLPANKEMFQSQIDALPVQMAYVEAEGERLAFLEAKGSQKIAEVEGPDTADTYNATTLSSEDLTQLVNIAEERGVAIDDLPEYDTIKSRTAQEAVAATGTAKEIDGTASTASASKASFEAAEAVTKALEVAIDDTPEYAKASARVAQTGEAATGTASEIDYEDTAVELEGREAITGTAPQGTAAEIGGVPTYEAAQMSAVTSEDRTLNASEMLQVVAEVPEEMAAAIAENPAEVAAQLDEGEVTEVVVKIAALPEEALVSAQMETLLAGMDDGEIPSWARPTVDALEGIMAQRGLSASTVGRDALFNAVIQSALPIAQGNATALKEMAMLNVGNEQQAAISNASNAMQLRVQNLANRQLAASETARMAQEIAVKQSTFNQQAAVISSEQTQQTAMVNTQNAQAKAATDAQLAQQAAISEFSENSRRDYENLKALNDASVNNLNAEQSLRLKKYDAQITTLVRQAELTQDIEKANLSSSLSVELQNLSQQNDAAKDTMTVENQERLLNLQTLVDLRKTNANLAQQMDMANLTNEQQIELATLQDKQATDAANFTADNQFKLNELNNKVARSIRQAELNARTAEINFDASLKLELTELTEKNATNRANMTADNQVRLANLNSLIDFKKTNASFAQQMEMANLSNEQQIVVANLTEKAAADSANFTEANRFELQRLTIASQLLSSNEQLKLNADLARLNTEERVALANLTYTNQFDSAKMTAENTAELQRYEKQMEAGRVNAQLAQQMGLQELSNAQQTAMFNAQVNSNLDFKQFDADQQVQIANSAFMQTVTIREFDAAQQTAIQNATLLANRDMAAADQATKLSIVNAQNFLKMDMANLSNEQQAAVLTSQMAQQAMLSDLAAENAAAQFSAANQQQADQYITSLGVQIEQYNVSALAARNQFNAAEANRQAAIKAGNVVQAASISAQMSLDAQKFNEQQDLARDQWNAANAQAVEQSNVQWRRQANTANTAAQNAANQQNAQIAFNLTSQEQTQLWQMLRDEAAYARQAYENDEQRKAQLYATAISNENAVKDATDFSEILAIDLDGDD